jgi:glyoxylase-like metal-dependent hydrolase (beta-lactamase superfamily II)
MAPHSLGPDLFVWTSACNVYVVRAGSTAVAIDAGDGAWIADLPALGVERLEHIYLTHHHADQCALPPGWREGAATRDTVVHAPSGEEPFLDPERVRASFATDSYLGQGCPASYAVRAGGLEGVRYDMVGFWDLFWGERRIRFLHTPGHSQAACSVVLDQGGRQIVFCGDAAHARGTVWQPYHLDWDHWTGKGALAAWEGVERLRGVSMDLLCPSHGAAIRGHRTTTTLLATLSRRLLALYRAKGSIAAGAPDAYVDPVATAGAARRYSEHLHQFGGNGYLLTSRSGEAMVVDPTLPDLPALEELRAAVGSPRVTACVVSHYHYDHCDAGPELGKRFGARLVLHPWVAEPLRDVRSLEAPWLPPESIHADELWPEEGEWRWSEYVFRVAPFPGQTRWHCVFMAEIDGRRVAFTGDSFQPASRWNGTGGFCAYNRSLFQDGFARSARLMLAWAPDWLAAGHGTVARYDAARFRAVIGWSRRAEAAVRALCPTGDLDRDYYAWGRGATRRC